MNHLFPIVIVRRLLRGSLAKQPEAVRKAARNLLSEISIARRSRRSLPQFQKLTRNKNLKLHLGCGGEMKEGWVNLDLAFNSTLLPAEADRPKNALFIDYDLRLGNLPLADASCEIIYSSHFFEHLEYKNALQLIRDCHRVLQNGGTFRIVLPTFKAMFKAYLTNDYQYFDLINIRQLIPEIDPGTETLVDMVNYGVYQNGEHKCVYDEEKVILLLRHIGFTSVAASSFESGIDPGDELRRRYSFYIEAVK